MDGQNLSRRSSQVSFLYIHSCLKLPSSLGQQNMRKIILNHAAYITYNLYSWSILILCKFNTLSNFQKPIWKGLAAFIKMNASIFQFYEFSKKLSSASFLPPNWADFPPDWLLGTYIPIKNALLAYVSNLWYTKKFFKIVYPFIKCFWIKPFTFFEKYIFLVHLHHCGYFLFNLSWRNRQCINLLTSSKFEKVTNHFPKPWKSTFSDLQTPCSKLQFFLFRSWTILK